MTRTVACGVQAVADEAEAESGAAAMAPFPPSDPGRGVSRQSIGVDGGVGTW